MKHIIVESCLGCPDCIKTNTGKAICKLTGQIFENGDTTIPENCPLPGYEKKPFEAMTGQEVAKRLGMSYSFVTKCANTKELPAHKIGGALLFNWNEVLKALENK